MATLIDGGKERKRTTKTIDSEKYGIALSHLTMTCTGGRQAASVRIDSQFAVPMMFEVPFFRCSDMVLYSSSSKTLFAFLAATCIGCSNSSPPNGRDTRSGNSEPRHSAENSAHPPIVGERSSHESVELTDDVTFWNESNAAEATIPASIPVYRGAIPNHGISAGAFFTMFWKTTDERSKVIEFYQNALVDAGWNVTSDIAQGHFDAEQSGKRLQVFVVGTGRPTLIIAQMSQQEQ